MDQAKRALYAAFPHTIPILTGFLFLGTTYGILMSANGLGGLWPAFESIFVFGGSIQFAAIPLLAGTFAPLEAFLLSVAVNARHLFYGLSLLEKYKGLNKVKPLLIFWLCDETFSVVSSVNLPAGVDRKWFYFWISLLDYGYWVTGSLIGGLLGALVTVDIPGLDFVLTALFVVLFIEQWKEKGNRLPAVIGVGCAVACLLVVGPNDFIIPAMALILVALTFLRSRLDEKEARS